MLTIRQQHKLRRMFDEEREVVKVANVPGLKWSL